ncbi:MAG: PAS domain S-box protein [Candidatus Obscuribacterales bacterium]|nr:PAS domain S-box protein [Candidatus Obscuribacterales bacterium]
MFIKDEMTEKDQLSLMFQALEYARNGVVITDPQKDDNPIIYTNPAFTDITGYSADEILGKNCRFLQGNDKSQLELEALRQAIRERLPITTVLRNYKKDGARFYNELTVSPVYNQNNKLIAFVGIQNDVTARIEAEQRISDFYSIVSHELRTPITKIKSSLSVIADGEAGPINSTVARFVEISRNSADSLWHLIENILDFKKLESGKFRLLKQKLLLSDLVENVVADFSPVSSQSSISLSCKSDDRSYVYADGQRLVQVLENLLSNAVKFSPAESSVLVRICRSENKSARVEVTDNGPGISAEDKAKLFEKFQQLESPDRRMRGGTGLGLAVCKAIIEAHQGRIGVESQTKQGSTFWFELPLYP